MAYECYIRSFFSDDYLLNYTACILNIYLNRGVVVVGGFGNAPGAYQLIGPTYVLVDQYGTIYVSETHGNRVTKWVPGSSTGIVIAGGTVGLGLNQLHTNYGFKFDAVGNLYVADCGSDRVMKYQILNACSSGGKHRRLLLIHTSMSAS